MSELDDFIGIACDHAGFQLKEILKRYKGEEFFDDFGCDSEESCDYPDYAHRLCQAIQEGSIDRGVLICGTGNGMQMTANKHLGIRAALCWNSDLAILARCHNRANVLVLPSRFVKPEEAVEILEMFLQTPFSGGRHQRRVNKLENHFENKNVCYILTGIK